MPEVGRVVPLAVGHGELRIAERWRLARALRREAYTQAIVVKRTLKSALVPMFAGVPRRTGELGEARYGLINDVRETRSEDVPLNHHRYALLGVDKGESLDAEALPAPELRVDMANQKAVLARTGLDTGSGSVGFAPGAAYGPAKRWPDDHWVKLARAVVARGRSVWIFGSAAERALGDAIATQAGMGVHNLAGQTSLPDVVDLASLCEAFVSNDSGLMHVAAAAGAYVVALFGSTDPRNTPPLALRRTILWRRLDCSPCFARKCPLGHLDCLEGISPAQVLQACLVDAVEGGSAEGSQSDKD